MATGDLKQRAIDETPAARATARFIEAVPWTFAKTVPHMPHEYVIRDWDEVPDERFDAFVQHIRAEGYRARWDHPDKPGVSYTNHYIEIDGWKYWFIRPRMLNRERLEHSTTVPLDA